MRLCVIPARGGSKRIPRKNLKPFCGRPILGYSIERALESGCFEEVMVSTDDSAIADEAVRWGASVPFLRPRSLSDDHTGTNPVVAHALEWYRDEGRPFDSAACVYATAPFLKADTIREGRRLLESSGASFVVTVASFPFPIQRALRVSPEGRAVMLFPRHRLTRSQDLEETYHDAGQLYWGTADAFLSGEALFTASTVPLVLPRKQVQDIDTPEDWDRAEALYRVLEADGD